MLNFIKKIFSQKPKNKTIELKPINHHLIHSIELYHGEENELRQASMFLTKGKFDKAKDLFDKMSEKYPHKKGLYHSQIGVAYFYYENYDKALEHYTKAMLEGFNKKMSDDYIWETCGMLFNKTKKKDVLNHYVELFPKRTYVKQAQEILES